MGLESATHINQLNPANPVGSVDNYATADDHLRLVKSTLTTDLPNIGGVVTASHTELNYVTGVTSSIQTQLAARELLTNKNINNGYAGLNASAQLANAQVSAANVTQHQGSLALAATQITSGILPDARFPATLPAASGANLTALNATQLTSGTIPDARIASTGVTQHQASINIAGSQVNSGTLPDARIAVTGVTQHQGSLAIAATQVTSGVLADARVQQSNVTQHQGALAINTDQLVTDQADDASTSFTVGSGDAESIRRFTSASAITITLPNSIPSGWALGDSMGFIRGGAGTLTFSSAGTIRSPGGSAISSTNGKAVATLWASGVWELSGNV
jgi:hypothetical protein